jgi:hypothetical protein
MNHIQPIEARRPALPAAGWLACLCLGNMAVTMAAPARKCETDSKRSHHNDQQVGEQCENPKLVETREAPDSSEDERKANELEPVSVVGATGKKVGKQIRAQTKQKRQRNAPTKHLPAEGNRSRV